MVKTHRQVARCLLRKWFDLIIANRDDPAFLLTPEPGKPLTEAKGELGYAASLVEFYAEEARRIHDETIPSHRLDARILVIEQPVGVVAAITPWNFPAAMTTRKIAPALAAGCITVLEPSPETPLTAPALGILAQPTTTISTPAGRAFILQSFNRGNFAI